MRVVLLALTLLPLAVLSTPILDTAYDTVLPQEENVEIPECETNEVWMDCSSCEQKCGETPSPCPRVCQPARCHCPAHKGFKRDGMGQCTSTC